MSGNQVTPTGGRYTVIPSTVGGYGNHPARAVTNPWSGNLPPGLSRYGFSDPSLAPADPSVTLSSSSVGALGGSVQYDGQNLMIAVQRETHRFYVQERLFGAQEAQAGYAEEMRGCDKEEEAAHGRKKVKEMEAFTSICLACADMASAAMQYVRNKQTLDASKQQLAKKELEHGKRNEIADLDQEGIDLDENHEGLEPAALAQRKNDIAARRRDAERDYHQHGLDATKAQGEADNYRTQAQFIQPLTNSGEQLLRAASTHATSEKQLEVDKTEVEARRIQANARRRHSWSDDHKGRAQESLATSQETLQKLSSIVESHHQTNMRTTGMA